MELLYVLEDMRIPLLDRVFYGLTYLGSEVVSVAAAFLIYWCFSKRNARYIMANALFGAGLTGVLKFICRVPRPFVRDSEFTIVEAARESAGGYSFPSGHSQNATSLAGALTVLYRKRKAVWIPAAALALLVYLSRMYLGVHDHLDVLGGIGCGLLVLALLHPLMKAADRKPVLNSVIFGAGAALFLLLGLLFEFRPWGEVDAVNWWEAVKVMNMTSGCMAAVALSEPLERRYLNFETKAVWWVQILKTVLGLALIVGLRVGLKPVLAAVFGALGIAEFLRYFIIAFAALYVWPMSFKLFARLGKKQ